MPSARSDRARRAAVLPAVCIVALLPLAGCSDSKKGNDRGAAAPTTVTTALDYNFTGEGSAEFCQHIAAFDAGSQATPPGASAAEVEASLREALAALDSAVAVAPPDIKTAAVAITEGFRSLNTAMASVGFDVNRTDLAALDALQSKPFGDAVKKMGAYTAEFCPPRG